MSTIPDFTCNFCKKVYTSLSSLNYHQKTAKFCLSIQNKLTNGELIRCEHCLKEFTSKKNLTQHDTICKNKKTKEQNEVKSELENTKKELDNIKKELDETKLTIKFKDELIERMQKEIDEYKKIAIRPTTSIVNNSNNYQIQYNQLIQNIETFDSSSLSEKIKSITLEEMDNYDPQNLEDSVSHSLCNKLKDYTFCTDKARKIVVIKKEDGKIDKITITEFINLCLNSGIVDIRKYLTNLDVYYTDVKLAENKISESNFLSLDSSLQNIKEFMNKNNIDITDNDHPLKMLPDKVLLSCQHINKRN
jgi:hypothetical protein